MTTSDLFRCTVFLSLVLLCHSCSEGPGEGTEERSRAEAIIDSAIARHFNQSSDSLDLAFNFRGTSYTVERKGGHYSYAAVYSDSLGRHRRTLSNEGYTAYLDEKVSPLSPKDSAAQAATVNSVVYFVLLPAPLNDPAVRTEFIGTEVLDGKEYYKVRVSFDDEGGGTDFEDVYLYWFDQEDYSMDYLAYSFHTEGGGTRFRKAINTREINGTLIQDYVNFRGPAAPDSLSEIASLYKSGRLDTLSIVAIDSIRLQ